MEAKPHRFRQFLEGTGEDVTWWEEAALDGDRRPAGASPFPWVTVRSRGQRLRPLLGGLRRAVKWSVRLVCLSPVLILLRVPLARQGHWAAGAVTVGFVVTVAVFFALLLLYLVLASVASLLARGRPRVLLPFEEAGGRRLSFGPWRLSEDDLPGAGQRLTVRGRLASIGSPLPGEELLRDLWLTGEGVPTRRTVALDFALLGDGERPAVVRLESAPLVVAPAAPLPVADGLARFDRGLPDPAEGEPDATTCRLLTLAVGDEVELTGSPTGEVPDLAHFELGGVPRSVRDPEQGRRGPYRAVTGRPATLFTCTPSSPMWIRKR